MAAPSFVAEYESSWAGAGSLNTSVTVAAGDVLVVSAMTQNGNVDIATPSGGGLTWTLRQSVDISNNWSSNYAWTATAASAQTFTLTLTRTAGSGVWGFLCLRFAGSGGIGASSKANTSGAPSLGITTTQADSAVCVFVADWNAADGASRVWRTGAGALTEQAYFRNAAAYAIYGGYHANAGAAGAKTVGLTAPSQKYSIIAVEVLGASSEQHSGGGSTTVAVIATGSGTKAADGGSGTAVAVSTSGGGQKAGQGGSGAAVAVTASGEGTKAAASGSGTATTVTATGGGYKSAAGGSGAVVNIATTGGGARNGETMADRDLTILGTTEPVTGWEVNGPISAWTTGEPTTQTLTTTEPASAWATTDPEV